MLVVCTLALGLVDFVVARDGAAPTPIVNYQGVLRDQNDVPLSGTYDIIFRFLDAATAGNEILIDQHTAATSNAVTISNGLFNAGLGSGTVSDGSGPGTYTDLVTVFRNYTDVWLEVQVGTEVLSPRTKLQSAPSALNASSLVGHAGSWYLDTSSTTQTKGGQLHVSNGTPGSDAIIAEDPNGEGISATGSSTGVRGVATAATGVAGDFRALNGVGVFGKGETGGWFRNTNQTSDGYIGADFAAVMGINYGTSYAGFFDAAVGDGVFARGGDTDPNGQSTGVRAEGAFHGGVFSAVGSDPNAAGVVAGGSIGVWANGGATGGTFVNSVVGVSAMLASGADGIDATGARYAGHFSATTSGTVGVWAHGGDTGGYFENSGGTSATLASGGVGISAGGPSRGSYLYNGSPNFSYAYVPNGNLGIDAHGSSAGGAFSNFSSSSYAYVASGSYKIVGSGAVSFVQNHPTDPSKVIVYAAPEGDEVAVYTRGSARLVDGEARVKLGETFALVTNPDVGLTATATPRGELIPLTVMEVSPGELVVHGPAGSDAEFDYMVWGLRIGFEEQSIVQPKKQDSKIPSMRQHEEFFRNEPTLRDHTAMARFERMDETVHGKRPLDFSKSNELRDAIGVAAYVQPGSRPSNMPEGQPTGSLPPASSASAGNGAGPAEASPQSTSSTQPGPTNSSSTERSDAPASRQSTWGLALFPTAGAIDEGDVVSVAAGSNGSIVRSDGPDDPLVIGCAVMSGADGQVAVATSRIAVCRVSAAYGAIAAGDLLSPSPTAGMAMKKDPTLAGATILGRAIEPLDSGTGLVRVLMGAR